MDRLPSIRRSPPPRPLPTATLLAVVLTLLGFTATATAQMFPAGPETLYVERLVIEGNHKTAGGVIRRELDFAEGDRFPEERIDAIWDRLEDLGYFAFVDIGWDETAPDSVEVTVTVEEESTASLHPVVRYSQRHKYILGARAADENFRGRGERLEVTGTWYRVHSYDLAWRRPWLLERRQLSADLEAGWQRAAFVFRPSDYQQWSVTGRLRWTTRQRVFAEGSVGFGGFAFADPFLERAVDRGHGGSGLVRQGAGWRDHLVVGLTVGMDRRDMRYYPTRGWYHRLMLEHVDGRGFRSFTRWTADLRRYVPTTWKHVIALRAYGRLVSAPLPPEDRLYWGGAANLRGYDYASLEGEEAYLLTAEYRWPLFLMPISPRGRVIGVGVHFFGDLGDVWYHGAGPGRARKDWGAGTHLNVSTLQFRFEVAWTESGEARFQFLDTFNF